MNNNTHRTKNRGKTNNRLVKCIFVIGLLTGLTSVTQLQAQSYDITFSGGGYVANGQIDVSGGLAISGYLNVTAGSDLGTYNLVSLGSPLINGNVTPQYSTLVVPGGDQIFDDVVNVGSNPFLDDLGLEFANDDSVGFNLWGNGPGSYNLFDSSADAYAYPYGTATITPAPEPTTGSLLFGLSALVCLQRLKIGRRI